MRENKQKNAFSLFSHLQKSETDMAAAPQEVIYHFSILRFYDFTINHFIGFLSTSEWLYLSTSKPEKKVTLWWRQSNLITDANNFPAPLNIFFLRFPNPDPIPDIPRYFLDHWKRQVAENIFFLRFQPLKVFWMLQRHFLGWKNDN